MFWKKTFKFTSNEDEPDESHFFFQTFRFQTAGCWTFQHPTSLWNETWDQHHTHQSFTFRMKFIFISSHPVCLYFSLQLKLSALCSYLCVCQVWNCRDYQMDLISFTGLCSEFQVILHPSIHNLVHSWCSQTCFSAALRSCFQREAVKHLLYCTSGIGWDQNRTKSEYLTDIHHVTQTGRVNNDHVQRSTEWLFIVTFLLLTA